MILRPAVSAAISSASSLAIVRGCRHRSSSRFMDSTPRGATCDLAACFYAHRLMIACIIHKYMFKLASSEQLLFFSSSLLRQLASSMWRFMIWEVEAFFTTWLGRVWEVWNLGFTVFRKIPQYVILSAPCSAACLSIILHEPIVPFPSIHHHRLLSASLAL